MHLILQLINQLKSKNKSSHSKENTMLKVHNQLDFYVLLPIIISGTKLGTSEMQTLCGK